MIRQAIGMALLLAAASGAAHGQAADLGAYRSTWLSDDRVVKIVVSPHDDSSVDMQYFNDVRAAAPYDTTVCSRTKQADGLTCRNGFWMALRSDGKLSTNEESHPPSGVTVRYVFAKDQPGP